MEDAHFSRLYPGSRSFGTFGILFFLTFSWNVDRPVNRELHVSAQLSLHHNGPAQRPHHCGSHTDPSVDLPLYSPLTCEYLCYSPGRGLLGLTVPVSRLRSPTSQPQPIGLLLQVDSILYCRLAASPRGPLQSRRESSLSRGPGFQSPRCAWRRVRLFLVDISRPLAPAQAPSPPSEVTSTSLEPA
ncbi:hypothetical protein CHARACLAT_029646 [Characodon lateralis]|uniref:Uncharacterized protein n=1 Tax=Characodon lateralis TaxID=208331 RepID=A0ABU7EPM7_9TELE|nr:hypothetical protein [Characodon lateralis]